jgi:hypothetical protein
LPLRAGPIALPLPFGAPDRLERNGTLVRVPAPPFPGIS